MTRKYFSGDTLAQALGEAARHFGVEPGELSYQQVDKRHGFLKIRRRILIEVDPEAPKKAPPEPGRTERERVAEERREPRPVAPAGRAEVAEAGQDRERGDARRAREPRREGSSRRGGRPRRSTSEGAAEAGGKSGLVDLPAARSPVTEHFPRATGEEAEAAREALERIFALSSLRLEAEVLKGDDQLVIEVRGGDQEVLLRDRGRLLLAIQHLLPRMMRGLIGRSVVCHVDSDNFREIREERLRDLAQRTADEVRRGGQPETLEPMSPDERRIVHLTLADDPAVETRSQGSGLFKRVTVSPARRRRPRGFDPYRR